MAKRTTTPPPGNAPQEGAGIRGEAIDYARQGQVEVGKLMPAATSKTASAGR